MTPWLSSNVQTCLPSTISGSGIVEASTRNIEVGTPVSGVVARVFVQVSQRVQPGDPLFLLDDRRERAALAAKQAAVAEAKARLESLQAELTRAYTRWEALEG